MSGDFLLAAQLLGAGATKASLSCQVRTPVWPSPPGTLDRVMVRLDTASLEDMEVPDKFDFEVIADPAMAMALPLRNTLWAGDLLLINTPSLPPAFSSNSPVAAIDMTALAANHGTSPGYALAGAAWAVLGSIAPEMVLPFEALENAVPPMNTPPPRDAEKTLLREAYQAGTDLLAILKSGEYEIWNNVDESCVSSLGCA